MLQLQPIQQEFVDKGFTVFIVTAGTNSDLEFLRTKGFPVLVDAQRGTAVTLGVQGIPHTFFVDADGIIAGSSVGWGGEDSVREFRAKVDELTAD